VQYAYNPIFSDRGSLRFLQFLAMAKGSTGEVRSQLYAALDAGFLSQTEFDDLYKLAAETSRLIGRLMRYLKNANQDRSSKVRKDI
jgi:four helix bundle protein